MIHFLRKMRHRLLAEGRLRRYMVYAVGEILLVVLGILIALQIDTWNTRRLERMEERKTYHNIRERIADDRKELNKVINHNDFYFEQYVRGSAWIRRDDRSKMDSLALYAINLSQFSDFYRTTNHYEALASSGRLSLLRNDSILSGLQTLEATYNHINKLEDIHWEVIIQELSPQIQGMINYSTLEVVQPEKLYGVEMQNLFIESIFLTRGKDSMYHRALDDIDLLTRLIEEEIRER